MACEDVLLGHRAAKITEDHARIDGLAVGTAREKDVAGLDVAVDYCVLELGHGAHRWYVAVNAVAERFAQLPKGVI